MKLVAYEDEMRQRSGQIVNTFLVGDAVMRQNIYDMADEDGSVLVDSLMDIAHDQEDLYLIEFLLGFGIQDYVFIEGTP